MPGICERNPCPKCGGLPTLAVPKLLPAEDQSCRYLVCWACDMIRTVKRGEEWRRRTGREAFEYKKQREAGVK